MDSATTRSKRTPRPRDGTAKTTKRVNWQVIVRLKQQFDTATDADSLAKLGRVLAALLNIHSKLVENVDLAAQIEELRRRMDEDDGI